MTSFIKHFHIPSTSSSNVKILNLILYSETDPSYIHMRDIQRKYLRIVPDFEYFFYCFREDQKEDVIVEGDMMYIRGKETYVPGVLDKTIKSIDYTITKNYKYLLRTNISTMVNIHEMRNYIRNKPITYAGRLIHTEEDEYKQHSAIPYAQGTAILLSKPICWDIVDNSETLHSYNVIDDLAIGILCKSIEVKVHNIQSKFIENPPAYGPSQIIFRHKTENRMDDVDCLKRTCNYLYSQQYRINILSA